jgi:predicted nucleotidyltransferase
MGLPEFDVVTAALRQAGAVFAFTFGSRARGDERPDSDLDVAAWWGEHPPAPWDVELPHGVDLLVLDGAPLEIAGRVALEGELLFDDDPAARVRWVANTRKVWLDERPRVQRAHREFLEASARGR